MPNLPHPAQGDPQGAADDRLAYVISRLPDDMAIRRTPDNTVRTRNLLAVVLYLGYWAIAMVIVVGGLFGRFTEQFVGYVVGGLAASAVSAAYFYFRRPRA